MINVYIWVLAESVNQHYAKNSRNKKIIKSLEQKQEYLELGIIDDLIYPLQKLEYDDWENLNNQLDEWNDLQRMILVDGILEIKDNKSSNYDTAKIFAKSFLLSEHGNSEVLIQYFEFLDNGISKKIELIDEVYQKTKWLESQNNNYEINFGEKFKIIYNLYSNAFS